MEIELDIFFGIIDEIEKRVIRIFGKYLRKEISKEKLAEELNRNFYELDELLNENKTSHN
mgnify:CR=1 FL=1